MSTPPLRSRQVHLDFHTSPEIPDIGKKFDRKCWQEALQRASINSITCFSKCHHGLSYHPTKIGKMHPHLKFDLLRAQIEACKEIDIKVPIYLSAGSDNLAGYEHPEWREISPEGSYAKWTKGVFTAGYMTLDFHSPYLDYLCAQIEEVVELFPDCDGIFLDIIHQAAGCGRWSMDYMKANGLDPERAEDRLKSSAAAIEKYYQQTTAAARRFRADMPIFHNSGHISRGNHSVLAYQSHLELESLPTGGWGYDHFPESAKYAINLGKEFLGMTGKFHTTWSEFGGYKHPNALRYECAAMIALGAKCSVGDQLHPDGSLDESTYAMIGAVYRELEIKEAWCTGSEQVTEIGLLSSEAENPGTRRNNHPDTGAARLLLEGHHLFRILSREMDFSKCALLILPDDILIDTPLQEKIETYLAHGGKLLLTGKSGLKKEGGGFAFDIGADWEGSSEFEPDYIMPVEEIRPKHIRNPMVMYFRAERIRATRGRSLGAVHDPYFNRTYHRFSGHQHTPPRKEPSGYDSGVTMGNVAYLAHPIFSIYRGYGSVAMKELSLAVIDQLLGRRTFTSNLPSSARVTLTRQEKEKRSILHLLYANKVNRGGEMRSNGVAIAQTRPIEVIEDLTPLQGIEIALRLPFKPVKITLEPQGEAIRFKQCDGFVEFTIDQFVCHQMVVFHEKK